MSVVQTSEVDVTVQVRDVADPWTAYDGLRRLQLLTNLIYDAITDRQV